MSKATKERRELENIDVQSDDSFNNPSDEEAGTSKTSSNYTDIITGALFSMNLNFTPFSKPKPTTNLKANNTRSPTNPSQTSKSHNQECHPHPSNSTTPTAITTHLHHHHHSLPTLDTDSITTNHPWTSTRRHAGTPTPRQKLRGFSPDWPKNSSTKIGPHISAEFFNKNGLTHKKRLMRSPDINCNIRLQTGEIDPLVITQVTCQLNCVAEVGFLFATNYRLIFHPFDVCQFSPMRMYSVPYGLIAGVSVGCKVVVGNDLELEIVCKDPRVLRLKFSVDGQKEQEIVEHIVQMVNARSYGKLFAFNVKENDGDVWILEDEKNIFDTKVGKLKDLTLEWRRMNFFDGGADSLWRVSRCNDRWSLCDSYPKSFIVPSQMKNEELEVVAKFRSQGKLPVPVWRSSKTGATMSRSSQIMTGLGQYRCEEDERLVNFLKNSNEIRRSDALHIYDARSYINALGNKIWGAGFESAQCYPDCEIIFLNLVNIHNVRDAFNKMVQCVVDPDDRRWTSKLENTHWLEYIGLILDGATKISESLRGGHSVLIHSSEGWDRTPQLTSLVQLLLDPYYRTFEGFIVLIEKEWLQFSHPFDLRCGHSTLGELALEASDSKRAPIFLQFLDCVHQIMLQYPADFEFNFRMLLDLAFHVHSCRFGTFLANTEKQRRKYDVQKKAPCLWVEFLHKKEDLINPFYKPTHEELELSTLPFKLKLWEEYFLQYDYGQITSHLVKLGEKSMLTDQMNKAKGQAMTEEKYKESLTEKKEFLNKLLRRARQFGISENELQAIQDCELSSKGDSREEEYSLEHEEAKESNRIVTEEDECSFINLTRGSAEQ